MSFYIDLTEFLTNPITTGIQRIAGEICRYMPPNAAIPVRFNSDKYVALPSALIEVIGGYFRNPGDDAVAEIRRLGAVERGSPIQALRSDTVLVPEVIIDPKRLAYFSSISDEELRRYRFIIYDLLPITHPEYFRTEWLLEIFSYYKILRRATSCGFISEDTREDYYRRLKRTDTRGGVVLPLGSDGFGPNTVPPAVNRQLKFTVLGTIEPRKNHELILNAFEPLLRQVKGLSLSFIGKIGWVDTEFAQKLQILASDKNSGFELQAGADDHTIRYCIEQSRATIYVSVAEGYGLPPVESLWVKTPVIAARAIPSLRNLSDGVHFVEPLSVINLRRAVLAFVDDSYAAEMTEQTKRLNLPTWQGFTGEVLRWCASN